MVLLGLTEGWLVVVVAAVVVDVRAVAWAESGCVHTCSSLCLLLLRWLKGLDKSDLETDRRKGVEDVVNVRV